MFACGCARCDHQTRRTDSRVSRHYHANKRSPFALRVATTTNTCTRCGSPTETTGAIQSHSGRRGLYGSLLERHASGPRTNDRRAVIVQARPPATACPHAREQLPHIILHSTCGWQCTASHVAGAVRAGNTHLAKRLREQTGKARPPEQRDGAWVHVARHGDDRDGHTMSSQGDAYLQRNFSALNTTTRARRRNKTQDINAKHGHRTTE